MRPDLTVDWTIPPTPPGWAGRIERFMGPGKSRTESAVETIGGLAAAGALLAAAALDDTVREWSVLQTLLGALLALDLVGGVLTNATNSAKRWYHRPGPGRSRARLLFVESHVLHLAIVAFVLLPTDYLWWWTNVALLAFSAALIELVPVEIKRPTAMAALMCALTVNQAVAPLPGVLSLVPALFYLKLLVGHMVPEAPMTAKRSTQPTEPSPQS